MSSLLSANLQVVQSEQQPLPNTIASAATITPIVRFTFISGTAQLQNITPFTQGYHEFVLCFTNAAPGLFLTTGNIKTAYQPIQNRPITMCYIPQENKYYVAAVV